LLSGKIYRHDDPVWSFIYPPNDWGCQCTVEQLSEWDAKNMKGFKLSKTSKEDFVTKKSTVQGKEIETTGVRIGGKTMFASEGWDYAPGEYSVQYQAMLCNKINASAISAEAKKEMQEQLETSVSGGFKNFTEQTIKTGFTNGNEAVSLAVLPERVAEALKSPAMLTATSERIMHSLRDSKIEKGIAMPVNEYLPSHLKEWMRNGVYLDSKGSLQIYSDAFMESGKLYRYKAVFAAEKMNIDHYSLQTVTKVDAVAIGASAKVI
jgi:hypothetical protein